MSSDTRQKIASAAFIAGFFLLWEFLCVALGISDIVLPKPSQVLTTLVQRAPALWPHAVQTLYTTLLGFALGVLAGLAIAFAAASFSWIGLALPAA